MEGNIERILQRLNEMLRNISRNAKKLLVNFVNLAENIICVNNCLLKFVEVVKKVLKKFANIFYGRFKKMFNNFAKIVG